MDNISMGGNKPNTKRAKVRSGETAITILKGSPVFYKMDGGGSNTYPDDGIEVVSAESLAAASQTMFAGLATADISPGQYKESMVHGICSYARVITSTRAATTDVWVSYSAGAVGDILSINTATGSVQALSRVGAGSAGVFNMFGLAQTYASATTLASSVGSAIFSASLFSTSAVKVFVRSL